MRAIRALLSASDSSHQIGYNFFSMCPTKLSISYFQLVGEFDITILVPIQ